MRARIFVDFWNLQLTINECVGHNFKIDWRALSPRLITEAEPYLSSTLRFDGTNVYLSYDPRTAAGHRLRDWSLNTLDRFPGIKVISKKRQVKTAPKCPICHTPVQTCPHCGGRMTGTGEKGIDTAIATDMISLAWEDAWDVAILISSDKDFIPVFVSGNAEGTSAVQDFDFRPRSSILWGVPDQSSKKRLAALTSPRRWPGR